MGAQKRRITYFSFLNFLFFFHSWNCIFDPCPWKGSKDMQLTVRSLNFMFCSGQNHPNQVYANLFNMKAYTCFNFSNTHKKKSSEKSYLYYRICARVIPTRMTRHNKRDKGELTKTVTGWSPLLHLSLYINLQCTHTHAHAVRSVRMRTTCDYCFYC